MGDRTEADEVRQNRNSVAICWGAQKSLVFRSGFLAPQVGLEPTTLRLTAECSAIELLRNMESGGDLLSRTVTSQVPSALKGLTSVFGMGTGGTPSSLPPEMVSYFGKPFSFLYCVSVSPGLPIFLFFLRQAWRCFHTLTTAQYQIQ